jgi:23S rRNA pseudouridine2605 synthase
MLAGRVRVNGVVASELGVRVVPERDVVELDGQPVALPTLRWIAFHKPPGVLTTRTDPHGGTTVYDLLPEDAAELRYVGRLDRDAEGLLLLTNDGDAANAVQHPSGEIEREYEVEAAGSVDRDVVRKLLDGVELEDGPARAVRARILERGDVKSRLSIVLAEGRKREVRRMMSAVDHHVLRLKRIRFGPVSLADLPRGQWRPLTEGEVRALVGRARSQRRNES